MKEDQEDKKEGKKEVDSNVEGEVKSQDIVCPICYKRFSSGKAFGGHKSSAHVQSKGQKSCSKKLIKRKYYSSTSNAKSVVGYDDFIDDDEDGDNYNYYSERSIAKTESSKKKGGVICHHCNKDFPSEKALFGHMRCHPDRPYRGMGAPDFSGLNDDDDYKNSSPMLHHNVVKSELEEGEIGNCNDMLGEGTSKVTRVVDLARDLVGVGWFRKGKRGGGDETIANSSSVIVEKSDSVGNNRMYEDGYDSFEECRMASELLMYMHNSGGPKSNLDEDRVVEEAMSKAIPMASPSEGEGTGLFLDFAMSKKIDKSDQSSNEEGEVAGVINQLNKNKGKSLAILENRKDDNNSSSDDDDDDDDDEVFRKMDYARKGKGKIAEKRRRKTNYNDNSANKKVTIKWNKLSTSSFSDGGGHDDATPPPPPPPPPPPATENGKEFRCSSCGKVFATHQALGGHKSSHNKFRMSIQNTIDDDQVVDTEETRKMVYDDESASSRTRRVSRKRKKATEEVQKLLDFDLNQLPGNEES